MRGLVVVLSLAWLLTTISAVCFAAALDDANKKIAILTASRMYWVERSLSLELILRTIEQAQPMPQPVGDKVAENN